MDRVATVDEIEEEIAGEMRERGIERDEAEVIVALRRGDVHGDGDLLCLRPLTDEQKRRLGIGRSIAEVLTEQRARPR